MPDGRRSPDDWNGETPTLKGKPRSRGLRAMGRPLSSGVDWENAENFAGRVCQTKAVRLSAEVAFSHKIRPALSGSDRLGFTRQYRRFPLYGNSSP
jgi:hypothetical protein